METIRYKKLSVFILVFIFILRVSAFSADGTWQWINSERLKAMMNERAGIWVVDIRNPMSYDAEHIEGAVNIVSAYILYKKLPLNKPLIIVDDSLGQTTASETADELVKNGYGKIYVLEGGISAWKADGNPVAGSKPFVVRGVSKQELQKALTNKVPLRIFDMRSALEWEKGNIPGSEPVEGKDISERVERLKGMLEKEEAKNPAIGLKKNMPVILVFSGSEDAEGLSEKIMRYTKGDVRYLIGGYEILTARKPDQLTGKCPTCPGR